MWWYLLPLIAENNHLNVPVDIHPHRFEEDAQASGRIRCDANLETL